MASFEDLDAFKACQELTLALYKVVEVLEDFDSELSAELWSAALVAPSRLARGSGFRNRKMFWVSADRSFSALSEISYYLNLCDGLGLIYQGGTPALGESSGTCRVLYDETRV